MRAYSEIVLLTRAYSATDLRDWVQHHNTLAFDLITIIDNESTIPVAQTIRDLNKGNIRILGVSGWPNQKMLYTQYSRETNSRWVLFSDDDEFLYCGENARINEILSGYGTFAGLCINWLMMGSKEPLIERPEPSCIDFCTCHNDPSRLENTHVKTFVKPELVLGYDNPHLPQFRRGHAVNGDGAPCTMGRGEHWTSKFLLYHYFVKTRSDWDIKCRRGRADLKVCTNLPEHFNQVSSGFEFETLTMKNYKKNRW